jgi:hypothetical protein
MPAGAILAIIIVCLLVAAAAGTGATLEVRRAVARRQFGPEYDRLASTVGHRRARAELAGRKRRVNGLGIRSLDPGVRQELASSWLAAQESFIDDPPRAVKAASALVIRAARERGYPVEDPEQLRTDLSVHHGRRLDAYQRADKTAASMSSKSVTTEELRQALLSYRGLFSELAESAGGSARSARPARAAILAAPYRVLARPRAWAATRLGTVRRTVAGPVSRARRRAGGLLRARPRRPRVPGLTGTSRRKSRPPQREGASKP